MTLQPDSLDTPGESQVVAVAAIVFRGERVLAMRRAAHKPGAARWETLSGRVHAGEEPLAALTREIAEESALEAHVDPRPLTAYAAKRGERDMTVIVYVAEWSAGEVVRSREHDDHAWLTPEELAARPGFPKLVEAVRLAAQLRAETASTTTA